MKKLTVTLLISLAIVVACGGQKSANNDKVTPVEAKPKRVFAELLDYNVVAEYPHSTKSYTQGLQYVDGTMWEGTGQEGDSHLQRIDLKTGKVDIVASLPNSEFGEGITHYKDYIYQLTWLSGVAHQYDKSGKELRTISYQGEGWGITTDGQRLFLSDGTPIIRIVNPDTFATESTICVMYDGSPLQHINELEWIDGYIWANVYLTDSIVKINPKTGNVEAYVDLPALRQRLGNNPEAEALNGIAYNAESGNLYVTGKDWSKIFEIKIID
jgi:glutamine cyclotransferase